jgi:hypothetical protein
VSRLSVVQAIGELLVDQEIRQVMAVFGIRDEHRAIDLIIAAKGYALVARQNRLLERIADRLDVNTTSNCFDVNVRGGGE